MKKKVKNNITYHEISACYFNSRHPFIFLSVGYWEYPFVLSWPLNVSILCIVADYCSLHDDDDDDDDDVVDS